MGAYLSSPKTEKESGQHESPYFVCGYSAMQGERQGLVTRGSKTFPNFRIRRGAGSAAIDVINFICELDLRLDRCGAPPRGALAPGGSPSAARDLGRPPLGPRPLRRSLRLRRF